MSSPAPGNSTEATGTRALLALAWPVVLARSTQSVVGLADAAMVAPLGSEALAAATTGSLNTFSFIIFPMGLVFIVQSFAAQLHGRGEPAASRRYAMYGLGVAVLAMVAAIAGIPFLGQLLATFRYEPAVHAGITEYMAWRVWSAGAVVGTEALGNWFSGLGDTRVQMRASVVTMVSNLALNWVLIYGELGAPAMGVKGAALASGIASVLGFLVVAFAYHVRSRELGGHEPLRLRGSEFLRMLRFGVPNGINWFMEFSAFVLFINALVAPLGTGVLAAFNVILNINSVSFMPAFGLSSAGAILVGQAIGRRMHDEVWPIVRRTARVMLVWQGSVGLLYLLLPGPLMSLFAGGQAATSDFVRVGAVMLAISSVWQVFDALGLALGEALRAAGDTAWCLWARLVIAWAVFLPASWWAIVKLDAGPNGAMWCVVFYIVLLAAVLAWRFRSGAWRRIDLTGHGVPEA